MHQATRFSLRYNTSGDGGSEGRPWPQSDSPSIITIEETMFMHPMKKVIRVGNTILLRRFAGSNQSRPDYF